MVLQCTVSGTLVFWSFPGGEIALSATSSQVLVGSFQAQPVGVVNGNFTSTLTFPVEIGTVITCINCDRSRNDTLAVRVQGNDLHAPVRRVVYVSKTSRVH